MFLVELLSVTYRISLQEGGINFFIEHFDTFRLLNDTNFDRSGYKKDNIYGLSKVNKKVLGTGKFKDKINRKIVEEFFGLASKLFYNKVIASHNEMKKAEEVKEEYYVIKI